MLIDENENMRRTQELDLRIRDAFRESIAKHALEPRLPGSNDTSPPITHRKRGCGFSIVESCDAPDSEFVELLESFRGKSWEEAFASPIFRCLDPGPYLLTGEAFLYYLPAYLLATMHEFEASFFSLLSRLEDKNFLEDARRLTAPQREAIRDVARLLRDRLDWNDPGYLRQAERVLKKYWDNPQYFDSSRNVTTEEA